MSIDQISRRFDFFRASCTLHEPTSAVIGLRVYFLMINSKLPCQNRVDTKHDHCDVICTPKANGPI